MQLSNHILGRLHPELPIAISGNHLLRVLRNVLAPAIDLTMTQDLHQHFLLL